MDSGLREYGVPPVTRQVKQKLHRYQQPQVVFTVATGRWNR